MVCDSNVPQLHITRHGNDNGNPDSQVCGDCIGGSMNKSHSDKQSGELAPGSQEFLDGVWELMQQEQRRRGPLPISEEFVKWEEQRREDRRREERINQNLQMLWETLASSEASLNERTCRLLEPCMTESPHPLFETLRGLDYDNALDNLLSWEQKLARSTFSSDVLRLDLLSFETYECGDDAVFGLHCYGATGEDYGYGNSWPQLFIRVLAETGDAIRMYYDTKEIPHATEIAVFQWRPALICLLLRDFLQQSTFLVAACQHRLEVRMLLGNVLWYPIGMIEAGEFAANPNPLANVFHE